MTAPTLYWTEAQTAGVLVSAPTLSTQGMSLKGCKGFRLCVYADSGQTLSGSGSGRVWLYQPEAAFWMPNPDLDLSVTVSSKRGQAFPDLQVVADSNLEHRIYIQSDTITVSSGGVTWRIDGVFL